MKKLTSKKKLLLYGCSGLGVNMLNLIVGTYLCSALLTGGFGAEDIGVYTYSNRNLVIAGIWSVLILAVKIMDGVIDIPMSSFTDNLRTRWGRRRPALVIGFVPMIVAYLLFLFPLTSGESIWNTIWFGVLLGVFYCFYTLTMLTFYATFAEVAATEQDMVFLSNVKSVCDVIYFILGYALLPVFIGMDINIRWVALIFLPLSLTMLIPLFLLKERSTRKGDEGSENFEPVKRISLIEALGGSIKNKSFVYWMTTAAVMNIGLQLFLSGINELFSTTGLNQTVIMASAFAPVPFTILLYNKIVKRFGLGYAYRYILSIFSVGMIIMYICLQISDKVPLGVLTGIALFAGLLVSFSIGAFFSVSYTVPSHLAAKEKEKSGRSVSSMYFAVQGLFEGVASGLASGVILVNLKSHDCIEWMPLIAAASCMVAFGMSLVFPKVVSQMGRTDKKTAAE